MVESWCVGSFSTGLLEMVSPSTKEDSSALSSASKASSWALVTVLWALLSLDGDGCSFFGASACGTGPDGGT